MYTHSKLMAEASASAFVLFERSLIMPAKNAPGINPRVKPKVRLKKLAKPAPVVKTGSPARPQKIYSSTVTQPYLLPRSRAAVFVNRSCRVTGTASGSFMYAPSVVRAQKSEQSTSDRSSRVRALESFKLNLAASQYLRVLAALHYQSSRTVNARDGTAL